MVEVQNLVFDYRDRRALDHVSFAIPQGSVTAMVGPNGAGKTTLLRCLATLEEPLSGRILIDGVDVQELPRLAHLKLGFLQDFFGVYEDLTVRQNLLHAAAIMGVPRSGIPEAARKAIHAVSLEKHIDHRGSELSRGLRQRLAIARTIVHEPKLLLLDEPASGLDPDARRELSSLIRSLQAGGTTLIVSSHILTELQDYSTHMLAVKDGKVWPLTPIGEANSTAVKQLSVSVLGSATSAVGVLQSIPTVSDIREAGLQIRFGFAGSDEDRAGLLKQLLLADVAVIELKVETENLEQLYFGKTS